jgi:hypothetical protein
LVTRPGATIQPMLFWTCVEALGVVLWSFKPWTYQTGSFAELTR